MTPLGAPPMEWKPQSPLVASLGGSRFQQRVTEHEKRPTQSSARQVRTSSPSPRNQHRPLQAPAHSHALRTLRGGARRTARLDRAPEVLFVVPAEAASRAASLELRRTSQRHVPLRRLSRAGRRHDLGGKHCLIPGLSRRRRRARGGTIPMMHRRPVGSPSRPDVSMVRRRRDRRPDRLRLRSPLRENGAEGLGEVGVFERITERLCFGG